MAITRIHAKAIKPLRFAAYDLEWYKDDYRVRVVGVFDARGYRPYRTVGEFLDGELTWRARGTAFFGHWSGRFDIQQLAEELSIRGYGVEMFIAGSGAPIVRVSRGRAHWIFADSASIIRTSLKQVGRFIGLEKLDCDTDEASYSDLCEYNKRDCEIVYYAIQRVQENVNDLGCEMKYTAASIALTIFRTKFLRADVDTISAVNARFRPHYVGARVERYREHIRSGDGVNWRYRDVNSSFPYSYSRKVPGNLIEVRRTIPRRTADTFLFAECTVEVPETCKVPPVPYRSEGRIFFPTGRIRTILTEWDLDLCELVGARITDVNSVWVYGLMRGLEDYAAFFFERKSASKALFERELNKANLNFVYGKFGERSDKERIVINPARTDCLHGGEHFDAKRGESSCMRKLIDPSGKSRVNAWIVTEEREIAHSHVPAVHAITSSSRGLIAAEWYAVFPMLAYGDTDSSVDASDAPSSDRIGEFKVEHDGAPIEEAHFAGSKLYELTYGANTHKERDGHCAYCGADMPHEGPCYEIRSKGFRRLSHESYQALISGEKIVSRRMGGLREFGLRPADSIVVKAIRSSYICGACSLNYAEPGTCRCGADTIRALGARPKRATEGDFSRPWSVEELQREYLP